ncbi:MAG: HlyC/CorC family transporter, partial [Clostridia bacterium]|nr:HlyC/CorC family transporter [Clostridia bacterium]
GYFSATETAFSTLNKTKLKTLAEAGNKKADLAVKLSENYDKLISTILIGNNIVNILLASIGTVLFTLLLNDGDTGATVSTVAVTVVVLIFGEITPKSAAKDMPERFAMFSAPIIQFFVWLFLPLNFLFGLWKKLVSKIIKSDDDSKMSQAELLMFVDEVQQEGSIDKSEGALLKNAIEFTERRAEDILTHRVDIEAVSVDTDKTEIAKIFTQMRFSRLPVYEESIDNIVGVIHQKDLYENGALTDKPLSEIMKPALFVQRSGKIDDLLKKLQKNKSHVAVVVDEYGGTYGLVTMEDILEELVGEIWDEHDEVIIPFKKIADHTYLADGTADVDEFFEYFGIESETESVSVGGWVMEQLEEVPEKGALFTYDDFEITVTETEMHRVTQIKVVGDRKKK